MPDIDYQYVFQPDTLGSYSSDKAKALASELWKVLEYYKYSRRPREWSVFRCDEAYLAHRYVPDTGAIKLIEDGEFGESDVFDAMNLMSIRQALALMPRNTPWLTVSSRENEADDVIQAIQDQQIFMHRKARTRRNIQRHLKQKNVRGRSWIYWEWREEKVWKRAVDVGENNRQLNNFLQKAGMARKDVDTMLMGRYPHTVFSGPVIFPIDLPNHRRPATAIRRFRLKQELLCEQDDKGKDKYDQEIIKGLQEYSLYELYAEQEHTANRIATQRLFGQMAVRADVGVRYVPIYIMYFPIFKFDFNGQTEIYYDTYFHVAMDTAGGPTIIFVEENPSDIGHSHIMVDDAIDWYTPFNSGGIGLVEKQLSRYHQKNLLQLLMVTGAAHSIVPAYLALDHAFREDDEISFMPGAINLVQQTAAGLEVLAPVPAPAAGTQLGEQLLRFYADSMSGGFGTDGLATANPTRSMTEPKTATQVNADQSTGSLLLDNQAENDSELLTDLCQAIFDESQRRLLPDADGMLDYERYLGTRVIQGKLAFKDFQVPRSIQVQGIVGAINNAQMMQNLLQGLDIASRAVGAYPQAAAYLQVAFTEAWKRLNIPMPEGMNNAPNTMPGLLQQHASLPMAIQPGDMQNAGPGPGIPNQGLHLPPGPGAIPGPAGIQPPR
jgi:hypothetical protein